MSVKVKPVRRIVTVDDEGGKSVAINDGPSPDVRTDPAHIIMPVPVNVRFII